MNSVRQTLPAILPCTPFSLPPDEAADAHPALVGGWEKVN